MKVAWRDMCPQQQLPLDLTPLVGYDPVHDTTLEGINVPRTSLSMRSMESHCEPMALGYVQRVSPPQSTSARAVNASRGLQRSTGDATVAFVFGADAVVFQLDPDVRSS